MNRVKKEYLKNAPTGFDNPLLWGGLVGSGKPTEKSKWYIWTGLSILLVGIGFGMSRFGAKGSSTSIIIW
ncbi:MAG: hypothetical protein K0B15_15290 [Lentimicrobium sp.]|nr:hypothetical protein [Lentimicrobium sp.]